MLTYLSLSYDAIEDINACPAHDECTNYPEFAYRPNLHAFVYIRSSNRSPSDRDIAESSDLLLSELYESGSIFLLIAMLLDFDSSPIRAASKYLRLSVFIRNCIEIFCISMTMCNCLNIVFARIMKCIALSLI